MSKFFKVCRVRCKHCGDLLEYENKTKQDNPAFVLQCSCMRVALDPSATLYRILTIPPGTSEDYEDLSEPWPEEWTTWDEVRPQLFTPEEIAESDRRVTEIGKQIKANKEEK